MNRLLYKKKETVEGMKVMDFTIVLLSSMIPVDPMNIKSRAHCLGGVREMQ